MYHAYLIVLSVLNTPLCKRRLCLLPPGRRGACKLQRHRLSLEGVTRGDPEDGVLQESRSYRSVRGSSTPWTGRLGLCFRDSENSAKWAEHGSAGFHFPYFHLSYIVGLQGGFPKTKIRVMKRSVNLNLEEVLTRQTTARITSERPARTKWENE